jgi:hypothetical protein
MEETRNPRSSMNLAGAGIPEYYERTVLRALPCNPSQLFVYWELPQPAAGRCTAITLSLYEQPPVAGTCPSPLLEIPVTPQTQNYYITVPCPGIVYTVVLTAAYSDGTRATLQSADTLPLPAVPNACTSILTDTAEDSDTTSEPLRQKATTGELKPALPPIATPVNPSSWSHQEQQLP